MKKTLKFCGTFILLGSRLLRLSLCSPPAAARVAFSSNSCGAAFHQTDHSTNIASKWLENCLTERPHLPIFAVKGKSLTVLTEPCEFYQTLKTKASNAKERIVLASLYLGTGVLEQELVDTIHQRSKELRDQSIDLKVQVLLEHTRGSRGAKNSRTMLQPLLQDFSENVKVSLYHTPKLRGLLRALVPERFNETVSAMHLKVYIFDDTLVMSGANLSNDYFTNRQDRCVVFEDCKELCDYFHHLVDTVSSFSLQLSGDNQTHLDEYFPEHPYQGNKRRYIEAAKQRMDDFFNQYSNEDFTTNRLKDIISKLQVDDSCISKKESRSSFKQEKSSEIMSPQKYENQKQGNANILEKEGEEFDTLVIPLIQMFPLDIRDDEFVTANLFRYAPAHAKILIATAYFNLTPNHWNHILQSHSRDLDIIMAHPEANGFFQAPGMAGGIPHAYTLIAKQCYQDIIKQKKQDRIRFWEYLRPKWTFHGKGLWGQIGDSLVPYITMIGSSNFGNRSVYRDLEAQALIFTTNKTFASQLTKEKENLTDYSLSVDSGTYQSEERKTPLWVFLIRTFMRTFF